MNGRHTSNINPSQKMPRNITPLLFISLTLLFVSLVHSSFFAKHLTVGRNTIKNSINGNKSWINSIISGIAAKNGNTSVKVSKNAKQSITTSENRSDKPRKENKRGICTVGIRPSKSDVPEYLTSFSIYYFSQSSFFGLEDKQLFKLKRKIKDVHWPLNDNETKFQLSLKSILSEPSSRVFASDEQFLETDPAWINPNPILWKNFEAMRSDSRISDLQTNLIDNYVFSNQVRRVLTRISYNPSKEKSIMHMFAYIRALILNRVRRDNEEFILLETEFEKAPLKYSSELIQFITKKHKLENDYTVHYLLHKLTFEWFLNYLVETGECPSRMYCFFKSLKDMMRRTLVLIESHENNDIVFPIDISRLLANHYMNISPDTYLDRLEKVKENSFNPAGVDIEHDTTIVPPPTVSFNEYKGQSIDIPIRISIGYMKASMLFGSFNADQLMSELAQVELNMIHQVRKWYMEMKFNQALFRYFIIDPKTCQFIGSPYYKPFIQQMNSDSAFIGHIPVGKHGTVPLVLPGESIVSHQRSEHRYNIIGMHNPSLINYEVSHILENKWMESKFWEYYVPHAMVKTKLLSEMIEADFPNRKNFTCTLDEFIQVTEKHFPEGWVLKGVNDYASEYKILSSDMDVRKEYDIFMKNREEFLEFISKQRTGVKGCEENEDLLDVLRPKAEYFGYKLDNFFSKTNEALVQHKMNILREFRVEVVAGRVLEEAILDRFYFRDIPTKNSIGKWVAKFVRDDVLKYLPDALKYMPMTMDIACIRGCGLVNKNATKAFADSNEYKTGVSEKDFEFKVIEANPGAQSWFSHYHIDSIKIYNDFLWKYPLLTQKELYLRNPMSPQKQIEFISDMITNTFKMTKAHHYPLYDLHKYFIEDRNVKIRRIDVDESNIGQQPKLNEVVQ